MRLDSHAIHSRIAALLEERKHFVVATLLEARGSSPQSAGRKMIIHPDGSFEFTIGGGTFESEVIQDGVALLTSDGPQIREYKLTVRDLGMYCQGIVKVFLERYIPRPRMIVFGGGHVAQALSRIAASTQLFSVVVIDDRAEYASKEKHPFADSVILTDRTFSRDIPQLDDETYIVVITRCHETDKLLVTKFGHAPSAYFGLIGSRSKIKQFERELKEEGVAESVLERLHAPIGIPLGGKDPAEIAVSILAEVIKVKNSRKASQMGISDRRFQIAD